MTHVSGVDVFVRLSLAAALGAIIGFERQWRHKPAGVHTTGLVSVGAALFALLDVMVRGGDTTRIMAGVVTGVGFIAGAVMFRSGFNIKGLNTAATIWATAAVGGLVGFDFLPEAAGGALAILMINGVLEPLSDAFDRRAHHEDDSETAYKISVRGAIDNQDAVRDAIRASVDRPPFKLLSLSHHRVDGTTVDVGAEVLASKPANDAIEALCKRLLAVDNVRRADWSSTQS